MIEGHGDDWACDYKVKANFSSNVYSHSDLRGLRDHLMRNFAVVAHYPEPEPQSLRVLLSERYAVQQENVLVTAGATQAIYMVARAFAGKKSYVMGEPTFREYEDACRMNGHHLVNNVEEADLVWLCNPNNPTGECRSIAQIYGVLAAMKASALLILDQSYEDFAEERPLSPTETVALGRVVGIHSFTKCYSIPGLRIGWAVAEKTLIARLYGGLTPWSVNALSCEAVRYFLTEGANPLPSLRSLLGETQRLWGKLNALEGLRVYPTSTHFMLCQLYESSAAQLKAFLLKEYGILIRDASNFNGLTCGHFRVCSQSVEENNLLVTAIKAYLNEH